MRRRKLLPLLLGPALVAACGAPPRAVAADYDGDRKADLAWFDGGTWYRRGTAGTETLHTGASTDIPVPGDYDGDGRLDIVVVQADGTWRRADGTVISTMPKPAAPADFRNPPALYPVPADYDGDGTTDPAWYRASDGTYVVEGTAAQPFGSGPVKPAESPGDQDLAVPADYDGDKKADLAVYHPRTGVWKIRSSSTGTTTEHAALRSPTADYVLPVPGDYTGAGRAQIAVADRTGWYVQGGPTFTLALANPDKVPSAVDLDGDGRADPVLYDVNAGTWTALAAGGTPTVQPFTTPWVTPLTVPWSTTQNIARITLLFRNCLRDPGAC